MGFFSSLFGGKKREKTPEELEQEKEKNFDILKFDGVKAQRMNKAGYAIKCFTEALALKEDYNTRMYLAQTYIAVGEHKLAHAQLQKMVELEPDNIEAYIMIAHVADNLGDWQAMNDACEKAHAIDDKRADVHFYFGKACAGLQDMVTAVAMFTKAITLDENFQPAYMLRCRVLAGMGQLQEAEKDMDKLLELEPDNENYLISKAQICQGLNKTKDAQDYYNKVISINPFCQQAYLEEGALLCKMGLFEKAMKLYNDAIEVNPMFADAYKERGRIKLTKGDKEGAAEDLKKSLELDPATAGGINGEFSNIEEQVAALNKSMNPFF